MTEAYKKNKAERIAHAFEAFSEHKAEFMPTFGSIQILDWRKPGTIHYWVRYVFDLDAQRIYISGDLGSAVVHPTWRATFEATYRNVAEREDPNDVNEGYFLQKVEATSDRYVYDKDEAEQYVKERCPGIVEEEDALETVMNGFHDDYGLAHLGDKARKILSDYDEDYWEWIEDAGRSVDGRVYLWLVGLKLAWKQLHEKGNNGEQLKGQPECARQE